MFGWLPWNRRHRELAAELERVKADQREAIKVIAHVISDQIVGGGLKGRRPPLDGLMP